MATPGTTALGIAQTAEGEGCDPITHRRIIMGRWSSVGVVYGLGVSGRTDLSYDVAPGCAVASRSDADGYVELYCEGGTAGPVSAGDPANPRIDVVWVRANDAQQGDPDNRVHLGVTEGAASPSPRAPDVPAGCTPLSWQLVPAGATSTQAASTDADGYRAIPYGASLGILLDLVDTSNASMKSSYTACAGQVHLATARYLSLKVTITMSAVDGPWADGDGSVYCHLLVDGSDVDVRELRLRGGEYNAVSNYYERAVEVAEGDHSVALRIDMGVSEENKRFWSANEWAGQCLQVLDVGPAF